MELSMTVKERKLLFRFTTRAWLEIEDKVGSLNKLLTRIDSDDAPMNALIQLTAACATAGEKYAGGKERITAEWLTDNLSPKQIKWANHLAKLALTVGMRREEAEQADDEIIDVVLEEIKKKEARRATRSQPDNASATD